MKRWTVAVAAVALSMTGVAACGSDEDDVDVPGVSTPLDETIDTAAETIDSAVDSMVDSSVSDTEIETEDTDASTETTVMTTRPPTAGGSPGTTTVGAATSNP